MPLELDAVPPSLVVFDGSCLVCNRAMHFIVDRDPSAHFRFAALDSELGLALAGRTGVPTDGQEATMLLVEEGQVHVRSDAVLGIARRLGRTAFERWLYRTCSAMGSVMPRAARDFLYGVVARNRHRIAFFSNECRLPTEELRRRLAS